MQILLVICHLLENLKTLCMFLHFSYCFKWFLVFSIIWRLYVNQFFLLTKQFLTFWRFWRRPVYLFTFLVVACWRFLKTPCISIHFSCYTFLAFWRVFIHFFAVQNNFKRFRGYENTLYTIHFFLFKTIYRILEVLKTPCIFINFSCGSKRSLVFWRISRNPVSLSIFLAIQNDISRFGNFEDTL